MLYNVLVSAAQQRESAVSIHMPPPSGAFLPITTPIPTLQVITEHRVELPVLYSNFLLALYFTYGNVYISVLLSQFVPPSPAPAVSKGLFFVFLFMSSKQVQVNFFSVFHRYMHLSRVNSRTFSSYALATTPLRPHCSL